MSSVIQDLNNFDFKFQKKYGQNFITDTNFLASVVDNAKIDAEDEVLEIGAGAGTLSKQISLRCKKLVSYEIDENLRPILQNTLESCQNATIIFADALKTDIKDIEKHFKGKYKIVANLPYYITTPLIFKFLEQTERVQSMTIMVQKEVADRIVASNKDSNYGVLSVMIDFYGQAKIIKRVSRQMFRPVPNVDSAIIKIDIYKKYNIANKVFALVVKNAFSNRRKTLVNNLSMAFKYDKKIFENILNSLDICLNSRAENLSTEQFVTLAQKLQEFSIIE